MREYEQNRKNKRRSGPVAWAAANAKLSTQTLFCDLKRHSESEIHLKALETLSKAAGGEGKEQKSAPDGTVPTTAQMHLAIDLLKTSTRAGQGALFETSCARLRRADPTNFPVGRSTRSTWSQIIQAAAAVERDVDLELLTRCRAIGWSEDNSGDAREVRVKLVEDDYTIHRRLLFVDDPKGRKVSLDKVDLVEEALKKIVPSEEERTAIKAKVVSFTVDGEPAEALAGRLLKASLRSDPRANHLVQEFVLRFGTDEKKDYGSLARALKNSSTLKNHFSSCVREGLHCVSELAGALPSHTYAFQRFDTVCECLKKTAAFVQPLRTFLMREAVGTGRASAWASKLLKVLSEPNMALMALLAEFSDVVRPFVHQYDTGESDPIRSIAEMSRLVLELKEALHNMFEFGEGSDGRRRAPLVLDPNYTHGYVAILRQEEATVASGRLLQHVLLAKLDQEHAAVGQAFAPFDILSWKKGRDTLRPLAEALEVPLEDLTKEFLVARRTAEHYQKRGDVTIWASTMRHWTRQKMPNLDRAVVYILATWASTAELEHGFAQYRLVAEGIKKSTTEANIFSQLKVLSDFPCADAVCRPLVQRQHVDYVATVHGNRTLVKFRQMFGGGRNVRKSDVPRRTLKDRRKKTGFRAFERRRTEQKQAKHEVPAEYAKELERKKKKSADKRATPEQRTLLEKLQTDREQKVKAWQGRLPSDGKKLSDQLRLACNPVTVSHVHGLNHLMCVVSRKTRSERDKNISEMESRMLTDENVLHGKSVSILMATESSRHSETVNALSHLPSMTVRFFDDVLEVGLGELLAGDVNVIWVFLSPGHHASFTNPEGVGAAIAWCPKKDDKELERAFDSARRHLAPRLIGGFVAGPSWLALHLSGDRATVRRPVLQLQPGLWRDLEVVLKLRLDWTGVAVLI
ncbi:unnamed protein product [Symbiodinium sp. CCMP2592]|nr:unnamed protein product [Symbiodinium sp. CCMP2592]